jgi:hypothetical protein
MLRKLLSAVSRGLFQRSEPWYDAAKERMYRRQLAEKDLEISMLRDGLREQTRQEVMGATLALRRKVAARMKAVWK